MPDEGFNKLSLLYFSPEDLAQLAPSMVEAIRIAKIWFDNRDEAYDILERLNEPEITENFYFILEKYINTETDADFLLKPREELPFLGFDDIEIAARDAIYAWEAGDRDATAKACVNGEIYDIVVKFTKNEDLQDLEDRVNALRLEQQVEKK
jgi:hypothetical protein